MYLDGNTKPVSLPLTELPSELLECILAHVETAQALARLSLTCRGLHAIIETQGYRIFSQSRFPSFGTRHLEVHAGNGEVTVQISPKFWKDAARGLTALSQNLDRRAFVAQTIREPGSQGADKLIGTFRRRRRYGPSIGFMPVIDSYEAWYGGDWASRKEVVAWGAGAKLVVRARNLGWGSLECREDETTDLKLEPCWQTFAKQGAREGVDDITTLNLLRHENSNAEEVLIGRASGHLELVHLDGRSEAKTLAKYDTRGMPARYSTIYPYNRHVAAICLGDHTVALYSLSREGENIKSYGDASVDKAGGRLRTWSTKFLSRERLAVGLGRSDNPIRLFNLGQSSCTFERTIQLACDSHPDSLRLDSPVPDPPGTAVYSIAPLCPSSTSSGAEGDVFLSGAYDGHVRLHDLRLAKTVVNIYSDQVDASSAIYSLLSVGQERFIAGGAQHSLIKVFDLRMPGSRLYHAADALPCAKQPQPSPHRAEPFHQTRAQPSDFNHCSIQRRCEFHSSIRRPRDWNVFLGTRSHGHDQSLESSVYSLSRPSSISPVIYAGVQNCITQLDLVSVLDRYPDPIHCSRSNPSPAFDRYSCTEPSSRSSNHSSNDPASAPAGPMDKVGPGKWDPNQVLNLTMYEQADQVTLLHQRPIRSLSSFTSSSPSPGITRNRADIFQDLDERWCSSCIA